MTGVDNFRYETWEIDEMVSAIERPQPFLLDTFFPNVAVSEAATIEWDIEEGGVRLAPFVSPYVQGRHVRSRGHATASLKPAYIKPKKTLQPTDAYVRMAGERYGGDLTPRQRMDRLLAKQIAAHEDMLTARLEWMAASALVNGSIAISGEDYQAVTVDFGQSSDLRAAIASGVQWDEANGDPLADIEDMALKVRKKSYGATVDTLVMDGTAWKLFAKKMEGKPIFDTTKRLGEGTLNTAPRADITGERVGNLGGRFEVYVYDGHYEDNEGAMTPYLANYTVLLASRRGIAGKQYFGAIQDLEAGLVAMRMFHKTWPEKDPSGLVLLSQSAPVVAPKRRNAFARLTVKS